MTDHSVRFSHLSPVMQGIVTLLTIVGFVVPCCLGFVNLDKRIDIVEDDYTKHVVSDEKRWDKAIDDIDSNEDAIHALQLVDKGLTIQYQEILKNQDRMVRYLENLERAE